MLFTTADDVHETLGRLLQELSADAELAPRLSRLDTVVQLRCRLPDTTLTLYVKATDAPTVVLGDLPEGAAGPELVLTLDADVAHALWLGKQNIAIGLARGAIQAKGDTNTIVELLRMTDEIAPRYEQLLRAAGRDDLADAEAPEHAPTAQAADAGNAGGNAAAEAGTAEGEATTEDAASTDEPAADAGAGTETGETEAGSETPEAAPAAEAETN